MEFDDLKIAIKKRKMLENNNSNEGCNLVLKSYKLGEKIIVYIPEDAIEVTEEKILKRYPHRHEKMKLIELPNHEADFVFHLENDLPCEDGQVSGLITNLKSFIMRTNPSNSFYSEGIEESSGFNVKWFDFDSFGLNEKIYNIVFFTLIKDIFLSGCFHCAAENTLLWKPVFINILQSFKEWSEEDEN